MPFPEGIAVDNDFNVYLPDYWFSDEFEDHVLKFSPENVPPVASFTMSATLVQAPFTVQFTDTSRNLPTSWLWDFGDGATSTGQNPVHTYTTIGEDTLRTYTVRLTATSAVGSNHTTHDLNVIRSLPFLEIDPPNPSRISLNPVINVSIGKGGNMNEITEINKIALTKNANNETIRYSGLTTNIRRWFNPFGVTLASIVNVSKSYSNLVPDTWYDLYYDGSVIARYTTGQWPPIPTVTGISPDSALPGQTLTNVIVTGTGFASGATIKRQ